MVDGCDLGDSNSGDAGPELGWAGLGLDHWGHFCHAGRAPWGCPIWGVFSLVGGAGWANCFVDPVPGGSLGPKGSRARPGVWLVAWSLSRLSTKHGNKHRCAALSHAQLHSRLHEGS